MSCGSTDITCNSLITIRSPLGEARLGAPYTAAPDFRPTSFLRTLLAAAEWLARERLRHAVRELDPGLLEELDVANPEAARAIRKLFSQ